MMGAESVSYSFYLLGAYLTLHLIAGVFVGIFASRLPVIFHTSVKEFAASKFVIPDDLTLFSIAKKPRNKLIKPVFLILIFLVCFALYQVFKEGSIAFLFHGKAATFIFRSSLFLLVWYFFLAPVLLFVFQKWLAKQQSKFSNEVVRVLKLLPEMKYITEQCWLKTKDSKGIMRLSKFIRFTFFMLLSNINAATHS